MELVQLAKRVRRGVKLLDKKAPRWRALMRKHARQFDFADCDHCIVGTLIHHSPAFQKKLRAIAFTEGVRVLVGQEYFDNSRDYGFDARSSILRPTGETSEEAIAERSRDLETLSALWRAEFE